MNYRGWPSRPSSVGDGGDRRKTSSRFVSASRPSRREVETAQHFREARVGAKRVEHRINPQPDQVNPLLLSRVFKPLQSLLALAEGGVDCRGKIPVPENAFAF